MYCIYRMFELRLQENGRMDSLYVFIFLVKKTLLAIDRVQLGYSFVRRTEIFFSQYCP